MFTIRKLTAANVEALEVTRDDHQLEVDLGRTVATFVAGPADVLAGIDRAIAAHPANGHPRSSLWAVRRKVEAEVASDQSFVAALRDEPTTAPRAAKLKVVADADVPAEAVTPAKVDRKLEAAKSKLAAASTALDEALAAERKARAARAKAMVAMRDAGASYAQVAEVVGMTPMSARAAILGVK